MPSSTRGEALAKLISEGRKSRGWTQEELSERSGVSRRAIAHWESGKGDRPELDSVRSVCVALGIHPRRAGVVLGLLTPEEAIDTTLDPSIAEVVMILQDPNLSEDVKDEWIEYLRYRRRAANKQVGGSASAG